MLGPPIGEDMRIIIIIIYQQKCSEIQTQHLSTHVCLQPYTTRVISWLYALLLEAESNKSNTCRLLRCCDSIIIILIYSPSYGPAWQLRYTTNWPVRYFLKVLIIFPMDPSLNSLFVFLVRVTSFGRRRCICVVSCITHVFVFSSGNMLVMLGESLNGIGLDLTWDSPLFSSDSCGSVFCSSWVRVRYMVVY